MAQTAVESRALRVLFLPRYSCVGARRIINFAYRRDRVTARHARKRAWTVATPRFGRTTLTGSTVCA